MQSVSREKYDTSVYENLKTTNSDQYHNSFHTIVYENAFLFAICPVKLYFVIILCRRLREP